VATRADKPYLRQPPERRLNALLRTPVALQRNFAAADRYRSLFLPLGARHSRRRQVTMATDRRGRIRPRWTERSPSAAQPRWPLTEELVNGRHRFNRSGVGCVARPADGKTMARLNAAGPPSAGGKRQMSTAVAIALMIVGAILLFALTGSPHWLNLRIVGAIFIVAGVLGLALPRLARSRGDTIRRWFAPMPTQRDQPKSGDEPEFAHSRSDLNGTGPTLADEILCLGHDPPA
jgi:hypothetical protein